MTRSKHDAHFTSIHVAQEAKRADHANLDFADVPIVQPAERSSGVNGENSSVRRPMEADAEPSNSALNSTVTARRDEQPSKYRNRPTDGYASKREAKRAAVLRLLQDTKVISDLREQVEFVLIPRQLDEHGKVAERACIYRADFVYTDNATGREIVEDSKGVRTADYIIKRKLMRFLLGVVIRET